MPDSERNTLGGAGGERERRNERTEMMPVQPGATGEGRDDGERSPEEAAAIAEHTYGKTGQHSSGERPGQRSTAEPGTPQGKSPQGKSPQGKGSPGSGPRKG